MAFPFSHAPNHVGIAGQVEILDQNGAVAATGDPQPHRGGSQRHIGFGFLWRTVDVVV